MPYFYENGGTVTAPSFLAKKVNRIGLRTIRPVNIISDLKDIDADGDADLLFINQSDGIYFVENVGDSLWPDLSSSLKFAPMGIDISRSHFCNPEFVDMDADGDLDLFTGGPAPKSIAYYQNKGTAQIADFGNPLYNKWGLYNFGELSSITAGDAENDGDQDLLVSTIFGEVYFIENTGTANSPNFAQPIQFPFNIWGLPLEMLSLDWCDHDMDGDLDLLVGEENGIVKYFVNTASANQIPNYPNSSTWGFISITNGERPTVTSIDMDNDMDIDVFAGFNDETLHYFENLEHVRPRPVDTSIQTSSVIEVLESEHRLFIYPNPINTGSWLNIEYDMQKQVLVVLYSINGQLAYREMK